MSIQPDDPRLTAYALGELDDSERAEIESALKDSPEARAQLAGIAELAGQLTEELAAETAAETESTDSRLSLDQREAVVARLETTPIKKRRPWILRKPAVLAMAASLILVLGVMFGLKRESAVRMFDEARPAINRSSPETLSVRPLHKSSEGKMGKRAPKLSRPSLRQSEVAYAADPLSALKVPKTSTTNSRAGYGYTKPREAKAYQRTVSSKFLLAAQRPLSTFSVDVDTAAYSNVRRFLTHERLPPTDAVRIEEMINYFNYDYPDPTGKHPFSVNVEVASAPWKSEHRLVRIGLQGKRMRSDRRPVSNLVFLVDVSGSMTALNKLPLLRRSFKLLVDKLGEKDRVALVVYAGASGLVLPSTSCSRQNRPKILSALERLSAGGSTNGGAGIQLAYDIAVRNFVKGGVNRVLLATDGDFNVGITNQNDLIKLIKQSAKSGVFLSVLGLGMGNYKDATLEQMADKGNGNYAYIDTINEARKVLVDQISSTLVTIAKDVKIQVEFNPALVRAYRLIGYENRRLAARDFNDDRKDAGDIGAGHAVTALYEVVPVWVAPPPSLGSVDKLKYARSKKSGELLTVKLRYKKPDGIQSFLLSQPVRDNERRFADASRDFRFATSVSWFGTLLRHPARARELSYRKLIAMTEAARGVDGHGYRAELLRMMTAARRLSEQRR